MDLDGRSEDIITTGITTAVVMVVAGIMQHAWKQPMLRLIDTIAGTSVGIAVAQLGQSFNRERPAQPGRHQLG